MTRVLALLDDRAGNNAQVLGVAEKMGLPFEAVQLSYNILAKLPNAVLGASAMHVSGKNRKQLDLLLRSRFEGEKLIVISAGRREAPVARWINSKYPGIFLSHLMQPECPYERFDVVGVPVHDHPPQNPNVLPLLLSPHGITEEKLAQARAQWEKSFAHLPHPRLGVLIGGTSKHATFEAGDYELLAKDIAEAAGAMKGSLLITTSRRTDAHGVSAVGEAVRAVPHFLYHYNNGGKNPYMGILACTDVLIVTADSIGMISEAAATGKPLYILAPAKTAAKFDRFTRSLYELGIAAPFALPLQKSWQPKPAPDAAAEIAAKIKELFEKR